MWRRLQQTTNIVLGPVAELGVPEGRWVNDKDNEPWEIIAAAAHPTPGFRNQILLNGQQPTGEHLLTDEQAMQHLCSQRSEVAAAVARWPRRAHFCICSDSDCEAGAACPSRWW